MIHNLLFKVICIRKNFLLISIGIIWQILNSSVLAQTSNLGSNLIKIQKIEFVGNTIFSDEELKKVIKPLTNELSINRLLGVTSEITDYYVQRGYISSGAFLPEQEFDGTLKIKVVEAVLTKIEIEGLSKINDTYITSRLPLGKVLNQNDLLKALAKLSKEPSIKKINSELIRLTPSKNNLIVKIKENTPLKTQFTVSNAFSPSIGTWGGSAGASYHLLGYGDFLILTYTATGQQGLSRYSANYSIPVNTQNGTLSFSYSNADSQIVEEPIASALDIQSDLRAYKLNFKQPVDVGLNSHLSFEAGIEQITTQSSVDDVSFAFTTGIPDGEINVSAIRLAQEYSTMGVNNSFSARSQFNLGVDLFDATVTDAGIDSLFWSWQGQVRLATKLDDVALISSLNLQLSKDQLLPIEQLSLGGEDSVRGYRENLSIGDNGVIGTIEAQIPVLEFSNQKGMIKIIPFIGIGKIWNNSDQEIKVNELFSAGLGLNLELEDWLQARINYAIPLTKTDISSDFAEQKISFSLQIQP
jgi:hemolysin activation/secretion protein